MSQTTKKTGKFGEPWRIRTSELFNGEDIELIDAKRWPIASAVREDGEDGQAEQLDRAAACVNALDGIPDPAKFVEVFGEMRLALQAQELWSDIQRSGKCPQGNDPRYTPFIGEWNGYHAPEQRLAMMANRRRDLRREALAAAKEVIP